jgi:chemotaxis-related protein WspB
LLLLLAAGAQLYAIDSERVVEVIPRVMHRPVSGAPPHRPGVFNFRGRVVPVLDVSQLIAGEACAAHLSSRIIMVRLRETVAGPELLGLLAERVTDTLLKPLSSFQPAQGATQVRPFLGGVALDERGLIQLLEIEPLAREALAEPQSGPGALASPPQLEPDAGA